MEFSWKLLVFFLLLAVRIMEDGSKPIKIDATKNDKGQRVSVHSHIKGLGLGADGSVDSAATDKCGIVGQETAREVNDNAKSWLTLTLETRRQELWSIS